MEHKIFEGMRETWRWEENVAQPSAQPRTQVMKQKARQDGSPIILHVAQPFTLFYLLSLDFDPCIARIWLDDRYTI
jgi:hypothetical protein